MNIVESYLNPVERMRLDDATKWFHEYRTRMRRELAVIRRLNDLARKRAERDKQKASAE